MTTCAAKGGIFAADTQLTSGQTIYRVSKLFRLPDGGVATGAGDWQDLYAVLRWLADGEHGECPEFPESAILIGRPDGTLWLADDKYAPYPLIGNCAAIGVGSQAAQIAMAGGQSAQQAVAAVCGHDPNTSAPVETMKVRLK